MDSTVLIFSENLKKYMERFQLKQSDIARITGVSQQSVSNWIAAKQMPRMGIIETLADYFAVKRSDLLENRGETPNTAETTQKWDDETLMIMETMKERPELKTLFSASRHAKKDDIETINKLIRSLSGLSNENQT